MPSAETLALPAAYQYFPSSPDLGGAKATERRGLDKAGFTEKFQRARALSFTGLKWGDAEMKDLMNFMSTIILALTTTE